MATKPTESPVFALLDQTDPISGQNNASEPTVAQKNYGFPRKARPSRQKINYVLRALYKWVKYAENSIDELIADLGDLDSDLGTLTSNLGNEVSARTIADGSLLTAINNEVTNRGLAVTGEYNARVAADNAIISNLNTEVGNRQTGDNALDGRLDAYDADTTETSGIMELKGFVTNGSVNFYAQFLRHRVGTANFIEVLLWLPEVVATSTSIYLSLDDASIPAVLRPSTAQTIPVMFYDNGSLTPHVGLITLSTTGDWNILKHDGSNMTAVNTKGIGAQCLRYRKSLS
jgi:hypothetical protein